MARADTGEPEGGVVFTDRLNEQLAAASETAVQSLVDEGEPSRRRLVVLDHQDVAGVEGDDLMESALQQ